MTFLEKTKQFLYPVFYDKATFIRSFTEGFIDGIYLISSLYFFEKIGESIQWNNTTLFHEYLIMYGIFMLIYISFKIIAIHWWWVNIYVAIDTYCANKYLPAFIKSDPNITERIGTWRFLGIYKKWKDTWMHIFHDFLSTDLALLVASTYGIIRIWFYNPIYSILIVLILSILLSLTYYIDRYFTIPARKKRREIETEYSRVQARIFMSKMEYMQNNELKREQHQIYAFLEDMRQQNYLIDNSVWWMYIGVRGISFLIRIVVYIFVWNAIFSHTANFWNFSTYILIVTMLETTMRTSYDTFRKFTREFDYIEQLWSTFDSLTPIKWYDSGKVFASKKQDIQIDGISYGYDEKNVFEKFSLTIAHGRKTAFVGASGGGKTTLIKLIAGYLHPKSWSISVMGNNLGETALKTYYPHIGYLTQDPSVFDATIRENLVSAIAQQSGMTSPINIDEKLHEALCLAHCDFVFDLEKWLDTEIGERGVRLSWWQKQRLAIAKIFLKDPEIILLDEPTSALDSFSEEQITKALDELFIGRTVIIVAHRLQTVKKSDDIIVIEWWEVVERGDHDELVAKWGIYYKMLELQSGF